MVYYKCRGSLRRHRIPLTWSLTAYELQYPIPLRTKMSNVPQTDEVISEGDGGNAHPPGYPLILDATPCINHTIKTVEYNTALGKYTE